MKDENMIKTAPLSRRELLAGSIIAAVPFAGAALKSQPLMEFAPSTISGSLRARAARKGLLIGACLDMPEVANDPSLRLLIADFNLLVPGNGFNWTRVQPARNASLDFSQVMPVYNLAQKVGAKMRMHDLVYDMTTPKWVKDLVPTLGAAQAGDLLQSYVRQVVSAWGDKVVHIEVVNEPGYYDKPGYRPYVFFDKLGEQYIDLAFQATRETNSKPILFTNEPWIEQLGNYSDFSRAALLRLLERLLKRGVPIQALGIEGHLRMDYGFSQSVYAKFLHEVTQLGLKIMVTELDINDRGVSGDKSMRDAAAASLVKSFLDVNFSFPQCLGILQWTVVDRYSWLLSAMDRQRSDRQPLRPGLFDTNYQKKPMWRAVAAALDAAPAR